MFPPIIQVPMAPQIAISVVLATFPVLCLPSPSLFCKDQSILRNTITFFFYLFPQHHSPLASIALLSVSMSLFLFCVFTSWVLWSPRTRDIIRHFPSPGWLMSLSMMPCRSPVLRTSTSCLAGFSLNGLHCSRSTSVKSNLKPS